MTMRQWDPWSEMMTLREAMSQLLQDSYVRPGATAGAAAGDAMLLDVYQDADNIEVDASLPGLRPEDVELTVQGDVLTIKGQRKHSAERKQGSYLVREQRSGNFYRAIQLPVQVDAEKAQASFEHGILHLTLPKAASTKPRQIAIQGANKAISQPQQAQIGGGHNGASQAEPAAAGATPTNK